MILKKDSGTYCPVFNFLEKQTYSTLFLVQAKGHTEWISDGLCDDINNNPSCDYDGDDCCGYNVEMHYCYDCNCVCKYRCFS